MIIYLEGVIYLWKVKLKFFKNDAFGGIRTIEEAGKVLFVASDVAKALGYSRPADAVSAHCKGSVKRRLPTTGGMQDLKVIPEGDVYRLITHSKLPSAEKFESWVFDEVIRKTGSYVVVPTLPKEELELRLKEVNAKQAELWMRLVDRLNIPEFKQVADTYAANTLAGKEVVALPVVEKKTYSATEIADILGISANKVGKLANQHDLKTSEYGKWFYDKSKYSNKEVETFRYYDEAINTLKMYI